MTHILLRPVVQIAVDNIYSLKMAHICAETHPLGQTLHLMKIVFCCVEKE
jgi:hypothetical protein